jgi:hypothetical protein
MDNLGFMCQTVQQGGRHYRISKNLGPVGKSKIGGNDVGTFFITLRQYLKKQFRTFFGKRNAAEFVQLC